MLRPKDGWAGRDPTRGGNFFQCATRNGRPSARLHIGRELIERGYPNDVEAAIELNVSTAAPLLVDGAYTG